MSVIERLKALRNKKTVLERELDELVNPKTGARKILDKRVKKLSEKTSEKGRALYEAAVKELGECDNKIACFTRELEETNAELEKMENDPTEHIEEQVSRMVAAFYEYVKEHFDELADSIETRYKIGDCNPDHVEYRFSPAPVTIFTENLGFIAREEDRYFSRELTGYVDDICYTITPPTTSWYRDYLNAFHKKLKEKLVQDNPYKDTFKVTFKKYEFTLELV